ncbi:MAG: alkaline phosphatase family protein [Candidatus Binatia bacterium]
MGVHVRRKLVLIAIDSGDSELVRRWAAAGYLPTLAGLLERGASFAVSTPLGVLEGAVWPTLLMSQSVGSHGMFAYRQIKPRSYDLELAMLADRLPAPPFWFYLSQAGKRVAIVDAPFARPIKNLRGIQVTNWGAHDPWCWRASSWPHHLIGDLVARFGEHPVGMCDQKDRTREDYQNLRLRLLRGTQAKTELLRYCLSLEDWDFFFGVFSEAHCVGHQFWHFLDQENPCHDAAAPPELQTAVRDVYQEIDRGLGLLLKALPSETDVLVLLSHGMGPYYHGSHLLNQVLERLEMDQTPNGRRETAVFVSEPPRARRLVWNLRHLVPQPLRAGVKAKLSSGIVDGLWEWAHPDAHPWSIARAFQVPSSNMTGGIRINLRGREPAGKVEPGTEYDELCRELMEALMELENPRTGKKAVQWVARARDLYQGALLHRLPDLLVEWDHSAPITSLVSPRIGTVEGMFPGARTGSHWQNALLIGSGPNSRARQSAQRIHTMDIAPTVLDFFGIPLPESYEGMSALAAFGADAKPVDAAAVSAVISG